MSIHIHLERFEGPLGLLLHLIRKEEMDIFDINVHHITKQYLDYIKVMRSLDLEVAGEFIAMAATLIHIKSKMVLPQYDEDGEVIESEDPRKELVQKLLEYQKFKEVSERLYERPLLGRDTWSRGHRLKIVEGDQPEDEIVLEDNPLFSLIRAYRTAITNMKKAVHKVSGELQSISERIMEIKDLLAVGKRLIFGDLFTQTEKKRSRNEVLVTFLSLLELARMGFVSLFQADSFSDIHIEAKRKIEKDVIARAESFESNTSNLDMDAPTKNIVENIIDESEDESVDVAPLEVVSTPKEESVIVEAATDEEIELAEKELNLTAEPVT